jgi:hypothetical protein
VVFRKSFHETVLSYAHLLNEQTPAVGQAPQLPNIDFDTGHPTHLGEYPLADRTYSEWVRELAKNDFKQVTPVIKKDILAFFNNAPKGPADEEEKEAENRRKTAEALDRLRALKM